MPRRPVALMALILALCSPGCSLFCLFCGPDDSRWVQISRRDPRATVETFKEAALRDNCEEIFNCLSEGLKRSWGGGSAGIVEVCVAWEKLKDDYPVHMLGYAEVTELTRTESTAAYELDVSGYKFRVELVRRAIWEVRAAEPEFAEIQSDYTDFEQRVRYGQLDREGRMVFDDLDDGAAFLVVILPEPGVPVEFDQMREIRLARIWQIDNFQPIEDSQ